MQCEECRGHVIQTVSDYICERCGLVQERIVFGNQINTTREDTYQKIRKEVKKEMEPTKKRKNVWIRSGVWEELNEFLKEQKGVGNKLSKIEFVSEAILLYMDDFNEL